MPSPLLYKRWEPGVTENSAVAAGPSFSSSISYRSSPHLSNCCSALPIPSWAPEPSTRHSLAACALSISYQPLPLRLVAPAPSPSPSYTQRRNKTPGGPGARAAGAPSTEPPLSLLHQGRAGHTCTSLQNPAVHAA